VLQEYAFFIFCITDLFSSMKHSAKYKHVQNINMRGMLPKIKFCYERWRNECIQI